MNNTHAGDICYNRWDMTLFLLPHVTQWIIKLKTSSKFSCRLARVTTLCLLFAVHTRRVLSTKSMWLIVEIAIYSEGEG